MRQENKQLNSFELINPVYQKAVLVESDNGSAIELGAKLYQAFPTAMSAPIYIIDEKNLMHSKKTSVPLSKLDIQNLGEIFQRGERDYILSKLKSDVRIEEWEDLSSYTYGTDYQFNDETLENWVDASTGQIKDEWKKLVGDILCFNAEKDERLILVNKASVPKGYVMKCQPHTLVITPPNTGKSTFYETVGFLLDKGTKNTLLGSARWSDDKAFGLFHEQYYTSAIDQIESQNIENMLGFLLGFLESGRATVAGGGTTLAVRGAFPLVITANPLALTGSNVSVLRDILAFMSRNSYAIGRRIGLFAFNNYSPLIDKGYDNDEHKKLVDTYRALEERANETLKKFWNHQKIKDFCNTPVYDPSLKDLIAKCEVVEVKSFLRAHIDHSFPHIRGGALNCAIMDNLPKFAVMDVLFIGDLDKLVDEMIEAAKPYVEQLVSINVESIKFALS